MTSIESTLAEDDLWLTPAQLFTLTGYRQPSKQVEHLKDQRIPFHVNRAGHPRVARAVIEGSKVRAPANTKTEAWSPSWAGNPAPAT